MEVKWIILLVSAWIVVALLAGVAQDTMIGGDTIDPDTGESITTSTLNDLAVGSFSQRAHAIVSVMSFDFPAIFHGGWAILRWIFFLPFVIAFGIMMLAYILAHIPVIGRGG